MDTKRIKVDGIKHTIYGEDPHGGWDLGRGMYLVPENGGYYMETWGFGGKRTRLVKSVEGL